MLQVVTDKHEDVMGKFGAILAQGIIDAGGRNATICLQTRTGESGKCVGQRTPRVSPENESGNKPMGAE